MRIYLAGPEVFFPDPAAEAAAKKATLSRLGHEGVFPLDNEIDTTSSSPEEAGLAIARANVDLMHACDGIIANLSPWHGPSADIGTVAELIYMGTLGKPVAAYSTATDSFSERVIEHLKHLHGDVEINETEKGGLVGPAGLAIENFSLPDNLMIPNFLSMWGTSLHPDFKTCAFDLAARFSMPGIRRDP